MKTTCPYCGVGCGVEVKDLNQPVSGDSLHPANYGRLCVKGSALGETLSSEGRLLWPQIHGSRVSLAAALDHVADRLRDIIAQHGPESVAFYGSGQLLTEDYYTANKLMKGFIGAANMDTNSRLCMASAVVGYKRAFGADAVPCCYEDIEQADVVVLVGSNAAWAHPVAWQRLVQAKSDRPDMKLVVIDPRRTASCDLADLHLALKPGSDSALFAGLLNWLSEQDAVDAEMLPHLMNVDATLAACRAWDLPKVAATCQLSEQEVLTFWQWFAAQPRVLTLWCMGINQSQTGSDNNNAIINAHLLSGKMGYAGAGPFSLTGQPNAMGGREVGGLANQLAAHMGFSDEDVDRVSRFWGSSCVARQPGLTAVNLFKAMERGEIKAVWIMGTNPAVSMPEGNRIAKALEKCELVVVSEVSARSDTADLAHVLLPAQGWGEKNGTVTNSERRISRQRSFIAPVGEAKPDWWLLAQVAQRLGFADAFAWQHPCEIFAEHAALSGFENAGRRAFDISALATITPEQYDQLAPVQWPINELVPGGTARLFADRHFFHPDGKARLLPPAIPVTVQTSERYPLLMNTGRIRDQWHTMTRTGNVPRLMQHYDEPFVSLHPHDAEAHGLRQGDITRVQSALGWWSGRVVIDTGLTRGQLFIPMHWTRQFSAQANVNGLVSALCCPESGQPALKQTAVRLQPLRPAWQGWLYLTDVMQPQEVLYWSRAPQQGAQRYVLAGQAQAADWLMQQPGMQALQWQQAQAGQQLHRLGWHNGRLVCAFYAGPALPEIDHGFVACAFADTSSSPQQRHALLGGRPAQGESQGRTICSCFGVGEVAIRRAIEQGCDSPASLGAALKCGTNCGSCIPELKNLLVTLRVAQ
ncbi:nitrate reductase [Pantoea sp. Acro-805]|uniref:Nitrate reductase n=1 Tax=Candidatus Pantoea formicae TaxID=2608355 RepID=A0ABX0QZF8_9GAMM|nr:nitrate reductase [Pantoea formicae]MDF7647845.1 nitrate reductase [Erwiniaceae bacterium L1_54_3]NIF00711.1 nitrate reductase [Pantoea formicae]